MKEYQNFNLMNKMKILKMLFLQKKILFLYIKYVMLLKMIKKVMLKNGSMKLDSQFKKL